MIREEGMTDPCANCPAPDPEAPPCETQRECIADERERVLLLIIGAVAAWEYLTTPWWRV